MSSKAVIVVAGGSGKRMNSDLPKQFLLLSGLPVLMRSVRAFYLYDPAILVVIAIAESYHDYWKELCGKYNFNFPHQLVKGGETRFHSVKNALELVPDNCLVAIHDGVRPLVSKGTISLAFEEAEIKGNAVPVIPVYESIRRVGDGDSEPVDREQFRIVQTPQVFRARSIRKAYAEAINSDFTDDATLLESIGEKIHLVEGNPENIKITQPYDMLFAEAVILKGSLQER